MTRDVRQLILPLLFFLIIVENIAFAGGYAIPPQTAKAESMGGAAAAGVDDPSAIYANPAALPYIQGNQAMAGLQYVNTISSVRNSHTATRPTLGSLEYKVG